MVAATLSITGEGVLNCGLHLLRLQHCLFSTDCSSANCTCIASGPLGRLHGTAELAPKTQVPPESCT